MMILLTYDVDYSEKSGAARLRKVAGICSDYGVRVQKSVFEMLIDNTQLEEIKLRISRIIDKERDSIRIYHLGKSWNNKITVIGKPAKIVQDNTLIL